MLFNGGQRFADSSSELTGNLAQRIQHVFFLRCLYLLRVDRVSAAATLRQETDNVPDSDFLERAFQHRGTGGPLADLPGEFRSETRILWPAHQLQRPANPRVGDEAEKGRLLQLRGKSLPQQIIEHRIPGGVDEVGQNQRVLVGQLPPALRPVKIVITSRGKSQQGCDRRQHLPPAVTATRLQPAEVAPYFGSVLIAAREVALQAFSDNTVQFRWNTARR